MALDKISMVRVGDVGMTSVAFMATAGAWMDLVTKGLTLVAAILAVIWWICRFMDRQKAKKGDKDVVL